MLHAVAQVASCYYSTETQSNGHKRLRPVGEAPASPSGEKRSRIQDEEDWLRHSPPPQQQSDPPIVEEASAPPEKLVSRYASEIDGDFIPVTARGLGDRVYAKISRVQMEQPPTGARSQSAGGLISEPIHVLMQRIEQEAFTSSLLHTRQRRRKGRSISIQT